MTEERFKVLLVDDSVFSRKRILSIIEEGIAGSRTHVYEAEDGTQALEAMRENEFDLIMLDLRMPSMSGLEVLDRMPHELRKNTIVLTASNEARDLLRVFEKGVLDYLSKNSTNTYIHGLIYHYLINRFNPERQQEAHVIVQTIQLLQDAARGVLRHKVNEIALGVLARMDVNCEAELPASSEILSALSSSDQDAVGWITWFMSEFEEMAIKELSSEYHTHLISELLQQLVNLDYPNTPGIKRRIYETIAKKGGLERLPLTVAVFKTSELGMELVSSAINHEELSVSDLQRQGILFSVTIAQGGAYHTGLYGALPVGGTDKQRALVHAISIADSDCVDTRLGKSAYVLTVLIFDSKNRELEYGKWRLNETLTKFFYQMADAAKIKSNTAAVLLEQIQAN